MIGEISKNINLDGSKIMSVIQAAIPKFLSAMQKNSSTSAGAAALTQALGDHAGQSLAINLEDGKKILSKVFGGDLSSVIASLGKQTGTSNDQVMFVFLSSNLSSSLNVITQTATIMMMRIWVTKIMSELRRPADVWDISIMKN